MKNSTKKIIYPVYNFVNRLGFIKNWKISKYLKSRRPWSIGYIDYKHDYINKTISELDILDRIRNNSTPKNFGMGLDERVLEYAWIFSHLKDEKIKLLDAGSTLNFKYLLDHKKIRNKKLCIFTFYPEVPSFPNLNFVDYKYGDLREMKLESESFDQIISQSTIEHIGMDNRIYGYSEDGTASNVQKNYDYMKAVKEMVRVLKKDGNLLLTFPFGVFKNYGFFQQFDQEMVNRITTFLQLEGKFELSYGLYENQQWIFAPVGKCKVQLSHNPKTGEDKGTDGAAHCRSVCLINFQKH